MDAVIVTLAERPDLVHVVAHWQWLEWGRRQGATVEQIASFVRMYCTVQHVPQGIVLLEDGMPAGTASLDHADLDARPDLTPWLANVFVAPEFRGRGHAKRLVRHIESIARVGGTEVLYLHTEDAMALYAGLGWSAIGTADHHGHQVTVMQKRLREDAA